MSTESMLDRIIAHLRAQVAELRTLEQAGVDPRELEQRRTRIAHLQEHLAGIVRDAIGAGEATTA